VKDDGNCLRTLAFVCVIVRGGERKNSASCCSPTTSVELCQGGSGSLQLKMHTLLGYRVILLPLSPVGGSA
jgi:hypothetical protein